MIKRGIIVFGILASWNLQAQDVTPYTPGTLPEGVVYYLPRTELQVNVTVTKSTYTPGEFCQYADRYLRLQGVSSQPKEEWSIQAITVSPFGVPNPQLAYAIKLKDKSVASKVELTADGILKAINTTLPPQEETVKPVTKKEKRINPRSFMTEEMLTATSSIKMAELVAKEIYNIRESKSTLIKGQADYMPKDGDALQIMLDNLATQEKALTEMFSGYTETTTHEYSFTINPEGDMKDKILCRFSGKLGILKDNDLAGAPIYISVTPKDILPPANEEGKDKKKLNGVIYNIPGKADVVVQYADKKYFNKEISIAQFGETEVLVNDLFNKKVNTRVTFNPTTGAIVKIDKD